MSTPARPPATLDRKQLVTATAILSGLELPEGVNYRITSDPRAGGFRVRVYLYLKPVGGVQEFDSVAFELTDIPNDSTMAALEATAQEMLGAAWDGAIMREFKRAGGGTDTLGILRLDTSRIGRDQ